MSYNSKHTGATVDGAVDAALAIMGGTNMMSKFDKYATNTGVTGSSFNASTDTIVFQPDSTKPTAFPQMALGATSQTFPLQMSAGRDYTISFDMSGTEYGTEGAAGQYGVGIHFQNVESYSSDPTNERYNFSVSKKDVGADGRFTHTFRVPVTGRYRMMLTTSYNRHHRLVLRNVMLNEGTETLPWNAGSYGLSAVGVDAGGRGVVRLPHNVGVVTDVKSYVATMPVFDQGLRLSPFMKPLNTVVLPDGGFIHTDSRGVYINAYNLEGDGCMIQYNQDYDFLVNAKTGLHREAGVDTMATYCVSGKIVRMLRADTMQPYAPPSGTEMRCPILLVPETAHVQKNMYVNGAHLYYLAGNIEDLDSRDIYTTKTGTTKVPDGRYYTPFVTLQYVGTEQVRPVRFRYTVSSGYIVESAVLQVGPAIPYSLMEPTAVSESAGADAGVAMAMLLSDEEECVMMTAEATESAGTDGFVEYPATYDADPDVFVPTVEVIWASETRMEAGQP